MNVTRQFFHNQKSKFTSFKETGKGEGRGAKIIDELSRQTLIVDGNQVSEWYWKGSLKFRMTSFPVQKGDVFSQAEYEIF